MITITKEILLITAVVVEFLVIVWQGVRIGVLDKKVSSLIKILTEDSKTERKTVV